MMPAISDMTSFKWATVTGVGPLRIQLDGDTAPLAMEPDSLVDPLTLAPGDRVRVELTARKCVVHGVASGSTHSALKQFTDWFELPGAKNILRPWDVRVWGIKGQLFRHLDVGIPFRFTKNSSGVVTIQGFGGVYVATAANAVIATLPVGYRPSTKRYFRASVSEVPVVVTVDVDGTIRLPNTALAVNNWVSFANIIFHDAAQDLNWVNITSFLNTFSAYDSVNSPVSIAIDSFGFVWTRGLVKVGSNRGANTPMFNMPSAAYTATYQRHFPGASDGTAYFGILGSAAGAAGAQTVNFKTTNATGAYVSLDGGLWQPTALDGLYTGRGPGAAATDPLGTQPWFNSCKNYDSTVFSSTSVTKRADGLVVWQGLMNTGTVNAEAFLIPQGYRPLQRTATERMSADVHGRLTFDPYYPVVADANRMGGMVMLENGSNLWVSLDGVAYQAAQ